VTPPPTPEAQLAFLTKLQRLFAEGDFTATYKFALLISLADLAVELGRDDGDVLRLTTHQIAGRFIDLYWQQASPYSTGRVGTGSGVLVQNLGMQAAVVKAISEFRRKNACSSPQAARVLPAYESLRVAVASTVSAQPLTYLQNLGGGQDPFLYERERGAVVLKLGVTYCLRRFQPLVQQLARSHWVGHIKGNRRNLPFLGDADDLEEFLFETPRKALVLIGASLRKLDGPHCFYCGGGVTESDVDHFVPFTLYPRDLMHNFVLAHPICNRSKSDTLAARMHLEHWVEYVGRYDDELNDIGASAGVVSDRVASRSIASWGYRNAIASGASGWVKPKTYEPVDGRYLECLA
jgi:5-methylcytosine-specific restriction endonuclease McrA